MKNHVNHVKSGISSGTRLTNDTVCLPFTFFFFLLCYACGIHKFNSNFGADYRLTDIRIGLDDSVD